MSDKQININEEDKRYVLDKNNIKNIIYFPEYSIDQMLCVDFFTFFAGVVLLIILTNNFDFDFFVENISLSIFLSLLLIFLLVFPIYSFSIFYTNKRNVAKGKFYIVKDRVVLKDSKKSHFLYITFENISKHLKYPIAVYPDEYYSLHVGDDCYIFLPKKLNKFNILGYYFFYKILNASKYKLDATLEENVISCDKYIANHLK